MTKDLPNTHSRSTAETAMNPIGQTIPVIHRHLEGNSEHPLSPVFGQKRPGTPGNSYFAQLPPVFGHFMFRFWPFYVPFLAILCFFPVGYSSALTDQHGPQEQLTAKFRPVDMENLSFFCKQFWG